MGRFDKIRNPADMSGALNTLDGERVRLYRVRLQTDTQATGNIELTATPANAEIITINDNAGNTVIFEFTDGGGLTVGDVEVDKSSTTDNGASELKTAIDGSALDITSGTVTGADPYDLPLTHDTNGIIGNSATMTTDSSGVTLTQLTGGREGNLDEAATTQVINMPALPANTIIHSVSIDLSEEFAGASVSAATVQVGDGTDPNIFMAATDVFTGAGVGQYQAPGVGFDGSTSGAPYYAAAMTPEILVTTTSDNVQDLQTGVATVVLMASSFPLAE